MKMMHKTGWMMALAGLLVLALAGSFKENEENQVYRSPETVEYSPDGNLMAVNDLTANKIYIVSAKTKSVTKEINLKGIGQDIIWLDDQEFLVSEYETGNVLKINARKGKVEKSYQAGPNAFHMAVHQDELWVGLYGLNLITVLDLKSGKKKAAIPIQSLPWDIEIAPARNLVLVTNLTPGRAANNKESAASITLIGLNSKQKIKNILLPHGSSNLRHLKVSKDQKYAYAVHTRGKVSLPTSQLEKGWVNTNMLSILDLENQEWYTSVLLDLPRQGGSDPWDIVENKLTGELMISLAGIHELARIKIDELHQYLQGEKVPDNLEANNAGAYTAYNVWQEIKATPQKRLILQDRLSALYTAGLIKREKVNIRAPRGMDLSPDLKTLAIAGYYSGELALKDLASGNITRISLGKQSAPDQVRQGEMIFHDASQTLENWLSCFTCHPDTRADGLNWDLLNDGIGNPKNTKSLIWTHLTPPSMSTGVRANYEVAAEKGFHFIKFYQGTEGEVNAVRAYLASLAPEESPYKKLMETDKAFSQSVERGKHLFSQSKCNDCHTPPLFTNKKMYDFGVADERGIKAYDVPTLKELWRTAPYWHDGSKATIKEILTDERILGVHGTTEDLDQADLDDLSNYLMTL